jgi:hypothetical protein
MTRNKVVLAAVCGWAAMALLAGSAHAAVTVPQKCASSKLKAAGKKAAAKLTCDFKGALKSIPDDTVKCLPTAVSKFDAAFGKADPNLLTNPDTPMVCEGSTTTVETGIDSCIGHVETAIGFDPTTGATGGKCPATKLKAAGKLASTELACYAKAVTLTPEPDCTDPSSTCGLCIAKAQGVLAKAVLKADGATPCQGTDAVLQTTVESNCVFPTAGALPPVAVACGNGIVDAGETCDDGNTVDCLTVDCTGAADNCPSNCDVAACTPTPSTVSISVKMTPPAGVMVGGMTLFVDYPEGEVRQPVVTPGTNVTNSDNDLTYGILETLLDGGGTGMPTDPSAVLHMTFNTCQGAPAPAATDFHCSVSEATDESFASITPLPTCTVTIP